jgi:hypothetical protein
MLQAYGDSTGRFLPGANCSDGGFHVIMFKQQGVLNLLYSFACIHSNGSHLSRNANRNERVKVSSVKIVPGGAESDMKHLLSLSGQIYWFRDSFECEVIPDLIGYLVDGNVRD